MALDASPGRIGPPMRFLADECRYTDAEHGLRFLCQRLHPRSRAG